MAGVLWAGVAAVVVLFTAFFLVGLLAARKARHASPADLMLAGRNMPLAIAVLTTTATWVDGGYLLGTVENTQRSLASGIQGGVCFGLSLILGGLFFAGKMRRLEFTTLVDPLESRFGRGWAAVLFVPAMLGEVFWSAELLVAIGATCGVILNLDLQTAILLSAAVVTLYTVIGGMWSVAYTDAVQLALIPIGLLAALPFALAAAGGLEACLHNYREQQGTLAAWLPPLSGDDPRWPLSTRFQWWDLSLMLILGGIPWNCYFQRVLSCRTAAAARWHSVLAGGLTMALTIPPLLLGIAAFSFAGWSEPQRELLSREPSLALPMLLRETAPPAVAMLGLAAIIGAVTSSFSASILSAGSMFSWNVVHRLLAREAGAAALVRVIRGSVVVLGASAAVMALSVHSVAELWFFTADLVFVLLFPQLLMAMFDPAANRTGSIAAFALSLVLRLGAGIPIFGLPAFLPYAELAALASGLPASAWIDSASGEILLPCRSVAAATGLLVLPVVSRLTNRWDRPRILGKVDV